MSRRDAAAMTRRRLFGAGWGLAALAALPRGLHAAPECADADWVPSAAFLRDLPRQMQALGVPGLGMAVVEQGRLAWSAEFGVANAVLGTPVDARTLFEAASLSKPVFAYAVLQLVDQGRLQLDTPLVRYARPDYLGDSP